jgi:hypothetical protein
MYLEPRRRFHPENKNKKLYEIPKILKIDGKCENSLIFYMTFLFFKVNFSVKIKLIYVCEGHISRSHTTKAKNIIR